MGPLTGIKVVELAAIGPGPFCCILLADMGAEVIRIDRTEPVDLGVPADPKYNLLNRNRRSAAIDLKRPEGVGAVKRLISQADALVEGFRPGVTERLGLGPDDCWKVNLRLVYGRMTGWGQEGPLAQAAGHDINYISLVGALNAIGSKGGAPVPPLNLVGDFGGGGLYLAFGIACALLESRTSGQGQVVDAAMVDGAASLMTSIFSSIAGGTWRNARGENILDGGAPWYSVYETKDKKYISIGSIEGRFYRDLLKYTELENEIFHPQHDRKGWPEMRAKLGAAFKQKTREEWCSIMEGSDICFAPVLDFQEAQQHPHLKARGTYVEIDGVVQPGPAPRFGRTKPSISRPPPQPGQHTSEILTDWGFGKADIEALRRAKAII